MIDTVIFDLDGTLLNTLEDLRNSTNFALSEFGFPKRSLEEVRSFVGNGVRKLIERAVPQSCDKETTEKCLEIFKKNYSENMYNNTAPYNSILEILKDLRNNGLKIGVVSNKFDLAVKELCKKYFEDLVDIAIGQADDVPKKPAPDGVLKAIKQLGAQNVVYVGDSEVDVQTAKNANIPCIGVTWGFRDKKDLKGADFIIDNPHDIINIIRSM
ncbi:MAG: HAD family hydrolase [Candidatus Gastranaerophilaceae bacterium]